MPAPNPPHVSSVSCIDGCRLRGGGTHRPALQPAVSDWYGESYYAMSPAHHPEGPATGLNRVLRGGSFGSASRRLRTTDRSGLPETPTYRQIGFRCAAIASSLPATAIDPTSWGRVKVVQPDEPVQ